jgi:dolichyl-phosphate-mannose--protein O-mannosyl transferase
MFATMVLGELTGWSDADDEAPWRFPTRRAAMGYWATAIIVSVGFVYFAPLTFGWPLSSAAYDARFWVLHPHL